MQEELKQDLETLENEAAGLRQQLNTLSNQRQVLVARIQQVDGAAAYLRGKLGVEAPEEQVEEKPEETTEENSEG
jgi:cell division protein FtsB|tara:strand:- start:315 stop:539 length:225 start_codon:yes stop_codon:yes gene_type:complete